MNSELDMMAAVAVWLAARDHWLTQPGRNGLFNLKHATDMLYVVWSESGEPIDPRFAGAAFQRFRVSLAEDHDRIHHPYRMVERPSPLVGHA